MTHYYYISGPPCIITLSPDVYDDTWATIGEPAGVTFQTKFYLKKKEGHQIIGIYYFTMSRLFDVAEGIYCTCQYISFSSPETACKIDKDECVDIAYKDAYTIDYNVSGGGTTPSCQRRGFFLEPSWPN